MHPKKLTINFETLVASVAGRKNLLWCAGRIMGSLGIESNFSKMIQIFANNMSSEIKLDHELSKLELLDKINSKIDSFSNRQTLMVRKVEGKIKEIESGVLAKVEADTVSRLSERIEKL